MISLLVLKYVLVSVVWFFGWIAYFLNRNLDPTGKRMAIVFAPIIVPFVYFFLFYWG